MNEKDEIDYGCCYIDGKRWELVPWSMTLARDGVEISLNCLYDSNRFSCEKGNCFYSKKGLSGFDLGFGRIDIKNKRKQTKLCSRHSIVDIASVIDNAMRDYVVENPDDIYKGYENSCRAGVKAVMNLDKGFLNPETIMLMCHLNRNAFDGCKYYLPC